MLLFVGLGNPGSQHARNRHNIGFMAIDAIARVHAPGPFRPRFSGLALEAAVGSQKLTLLKPSTFMNESGRSVGEAARFFKIGLDAIIVLHDELDLAPGRLRVKTGGGNAGHNGLRSITAHLGNDYRRIRMGIGHPGDKALVLRYVLNDFAKSETGWVDTLCRSVADHMPLVAAGQDSSFQNKVHLAMEAAGLGDADRIGST